LWRRADADDVASPGDFLVGALEGGIAVRHRLAKEGRLAEIELYQAGAPVR
jgi:hypothetical protein